jgi:hypothetical protein
MLEKHCPTAVFSLPQKGKRIDRIGLWWVGWKDVAAISNPPPTV